MLSFAIGRCRFRLADLVNSPVELDGVIAVTVALALAASLRGPLGFDQNGVVVTARVADFVRVSLLGIMLAQHPFFEEILAPLQPRVAVRTMFSK